MRIALSLGFALQTLPWRKFSPQTPLIAVDVFVKLWVATPTYQLLWKLLHEKVFSAGIVSKNHPYQSQYRSNYL